jgi:hypothetical protein
MWNESNKDLMNSFTLSPLLAQSSRSCGDLFKQHGEQFIPHVWQEYTRRAFIMITVACCYPALC